MVAEQCLYLHVNVSKTSDEWGYTLCNVVVVSFCNQTPIVVLISVILVFWMVRFICHSISKGNHTLWFRESVYLIAAWNESWGLSYCLQYISVSWYLWGVQQVYGLAIYNVTLRTTLYIFFCVKIMECVATFLFLFYLYFENSIHHINTCVKRKSN